jgi:hypothetical protein
MSLSYDNTPFKNGAAAATESRRKSCDFNSLCSLFHTVRHLQAGRR